MRALYALRRCARAVLGVAPRHTCGGTTFPVPVRQIHKGAPVIVHKRGADLLHDPWFNKVSRRTVQYSTIQYDQPDLLHDPWFNKVTRHDKLKQVQHYRVAIQAFKFGT